MKDAPLNFDYDYIIAGGGCAGLSLAYHLQQHPTLSKKRILIVDKNSKKTNDKTWCFWTQKPTIFDEIIYSSWKKLSFITPDDHLILHLSSNWQYQMIRSIDFYNFVYKLLYQNPNITFLYGNIEAVAQKENKSGAMLTVDGQNFTANYLFNSCFSIEKFRIQQNKKRFHYLWQHFKGWIIDTPQTVFSSKQMTLFDFRVEQNNEVHFFYVLPFSAHQALVEYTIFSKETIPQNEYDTHLKQYINNKLKITDYTIKEEEFGIIPMTDQPFPCNNQPNIINIGTLGGRCKPSTGYAFLRIQQDSANIAKALAATNMPYYQMTKKARYKLFDSMLLNIMDRDGGKIQEIFTQLFQNNPVEQIFRFLNETTTLYEDYQIMHSVPPMPFLVSLANLALLQFWNKSQ